MPDKKQLIKISMVVLIAGCAFWFWNKTHPDTETQAGTASDQSAAKDHRSGGRGSHGGAGGPRGDKVIPVLATKVTTADIPVIYTALGTVTPSAVVTVTSRIDGQLIQVLFKEGQLVKQGETLAKIDPRPFETALGQIQGQAARNQALLKNSQIDLERFKTLQSQDSIASQQVDSQASLVQQYQGTVQADRASVESAKLQLAFTNVTAPISGRIGLRQVDSGNNITSATPIAIINAVHPIHVVFTLPDDKIASLITHTQNDGNPRKLTVEAWDKSNTRLLATGTLASIDNQIDTTSGTIKLKAAFSNQDNQLFPNQFVNVRLHSDTLKNASVIPVNAVQHGNQGAFVYLINRSDKGDDEVVLQPVTVAYSDGERAAITQGLAAGARVVSGGTDKLKDHAKVTVQNPTRKSGADADAGKEATTQVQANQPSGRQHRRAAAE